MAEQPETLPAKMRAWQFTNHNKRNTPGIEHNITQRDIPTPTPAPDQHLVRVIATGLNPADFKRFEGILGVVCHFANKNAIPGLDFAGRIVTPSAGSAFKPGQLVFGVSTISPFAGHGPLSEYALVPEDFAWAVPDGVDPLAAAGTPVAGITAYQSIMNFRPAKRKDDASTQDRIFINGGSGGTGLLGIQVARLAGMHVTTTCSTANAALVRSVGADDVIDYREAGASLITVLKGKGPFDLAVDNAGHNFDLYWQSHQYLKPGSPYIMVAGGWLSHFLTMTRAQLTPAWLGGGKRPIKGFFPDVKAREELDALAQWMAEGKLRVVIDEVFGFDDTPQAFAKLKTGRAKGKIIVRVASSMKSHIAP